MRRGYPRNGSTRIERAIAHCVTFLREALGKRGTVMQVQHIRYFLALVEELNFTRAARRCGVSQPTLTGCIRSLEAELGGQLFTRKPKVSLTALGRAVTPHFVRAVRDVGAALRVARSFHKDANSPFETRDHEFVRLPLRAVR